MRGADQAVRGAGRGTGEQARPPGRQHRLPVLVIELASEVRIPVTEAVDPAEVEAPVLGCHGVAGLRGRSELGPVVLDPALDSIAATEPDHGVGRHRPMVGEEPGELGPGSPQPIEGHEHHVAAMLRDAACSYVPPLEQACADDDRHHGIADDEPEGDAL